MKNVSDMCDRMKKCVQSLADLDQKLMAADSINLGSVKYPRYIHLLMIVIYNAPNGRHWVIGFHIIQRLLRLSLIPFLKHACVGYLSKYLPEDVLGLIVELPSNQE